MSEGSDNSVSSLVERFGYNQRGTAKQREQIGEGRWKTKLYDAGFLSLYEIRNDDNPGHPYVFAHEERSGGQLVAVLPYREAHGDGGMTYEYLLRRERCPAWKDEPEVCALTGGVEDDTDTFVEDAKRELYEEAGYQVEADQLVDLGTCRGTKAMDTVYHLYTVDLTDVRKRRAPGDGSLFEERADCVWMDGDRLVLCEDAQAHTMFNRLRVL